MEPAPKEADTTHAKVAPSQRAETRDSPETVPAVRLRPPGVLKLTRSLSKSDSDLLVWPQAEEDGALGCRGGSVFDCSSGQQDQQRVEHSPSFASEWDEVMILLWCRGKHVGMDRRRGKREGGHCDRERGKERRE